MVGFQRSNDAVGVSRNYRRAYGHHLKRILADKIFRNREALRYCKEYGIQINGPKLEKRPDDEKLYREQLWQE